MELYIGSRFELVIERRHAHLTFPWGGSIGASRTSLPSPAFCAELDRPPQTRADYPLVDWYLNDIGEYELAVARGRYELTYYPPTRRKTPQTEAQTAE